ncbi:hypothetical protein GIY56_15425 [Paracoccus sp. YIM 132242]|uniref:Uncharacterized protein n=1 Tax=Paracoccus lichenicola TaxID=2665644 RepID=A0A6L6HTH1_9RHOB|nr:hypothetical protein [Paracoccus lichenicola]MTE01679.1 hypothetical protein [Paracoccus lichenicola]
MSAAAFQTPSYEARDFAQQRRQLGSVVQGAFVSNRVRIPGLRSAWNEGLRKRFEHLCSLPRGWDGYRGQPVSFACANFAAQVLERLYTDGLPLPSLVPGSDGTLQIEWHQNQFDIELDILAPNKVMAYRNDDITGQDEELELDTDFTIVSFWLNEMKARVPAVEAAG